LKQTERLRRCLHFQIQLPSQPSFSVHDIYGTKSKNEIRRPFSKHIHIFTSSTDRLHNRQNF
jgi:hypothetical protein